MNILFAVLFGIVVGAVAATIYYRYNKVAAQKKKDG